MRKKLTASIITKLQVPEGRRYVKLFDSEVPGLAVRKMASGVTTFIVERRPRGSSVAKQITIGRAAHYTVEQARTEGRKLLAELSSNDYLAISSLKSSIPTFAEAVESYAKLELSGKKQSYIDRTLGTLRRYGTPKLGKLKISEISHRNVAQIVTQIMQDGKHPTAEMVWVSISNVLSWAVRFGYLDTNPLTGVKPKFKLNARRRFLSMAELTSLWRAAECLSAAQRSAFRMLILLPLRKQELLLSGWQNVDSHWLFVPGERTKNHEESALFISDFAFSVLRAPANETGLLFTANNRTPLTLGTKISVKITEESGVSDWVYHDFRRTFSTHMNERGHPFHIIEACLNHRDPTRRGVAGFYNRAEYRAAKQTVLQAWSDLVEEAVSGG